MKIFSGLFLLLQTPEGWLSLLSLLCVSILVLKGQVHDVAFASVMTLIPAIMIWTQHKIAIANVPQIQTIINDVKAQL